MMAARASDDTDAARRLCFAATRNKKSTRSVRARTGAFGTEAEDCVLQVRATSLAAAMSAPQIDLWGDCCSGWKNSSVYPSIARNFYSVLRRYL